MLLPTLNRWSLAWVDRERRTGSQVEEQRGEWVTSYTFLRRKKKTSLVVNFCLVYTDVSREDRRARKLWPRHWRVWSEGSGLPCRFGPEPEAKQHHHASNAATHCHCQWSMFRQTTNGMIYGPCRDVVETKYSFFISLITDSSSTFGTRGPAKRGAPNEKQIFRWDPVHYVLGFALVVPHLVCSLIGLIH